MESVEGHWFGIINMILNVLLGIGIFVVGNYIRHVSGRIEKLEKADADVSSKIGTIEVLVAKNYVTREEFQHVIERDANDRKQTLRDLSEALFARLDMLQAQVVASSRRRSSDGD